MSIFIKPSLKTMVLSNRITFWLTELANSYFLSQKCLSSSHAAVQIIIPLTEESTARNEPAATTLTGYITRVTFTKDVTVMSANNF